MGILLTYLTLDINFPLVVLTYGGSFLFSFGLAYTSTIGKLFFDSNFEFY